MRSFLLSLALLTMFSCPVMAEEKTVIVPQDTTEFGIDKSEFVRISASGIAGSTIEIAIDGPAKVTAKNNLVEKSKGKTVIGRQVTEFELAPTDAGKVIATVTVKPPQPDAKSTTKRYVFVVE